MDINFVCESCNQELSADDSMAGMEIECPACQSTIAIPGAEGETGDAEAEVFYSTPGSPTSEDRMSIPLPSGSASSDLIQKSRSARLSVAAKADLKICCKTIMRGDHASTEAFDQAVTEFLSSVGEDQLKETHTVQSKDDFGMLVIYDKS